MKVLFLLGLEIQLSPFIHNRIKEYIRKGLDFDIYQPFITRNHDEYSNAEESFDYIIDNKKVEIKTPKGLRVGEEQLCFRMYQAMKKAIMNKKYDIIVVHWVYPHGYVAYLLSKYFEIPYIVVAHGDDIHTTPYLHQETQKYREIKEFTKQAINKADGVIYVSDFLKNESYKLGFVNEKDTVIPNGVDTNLFDIINKAYVRKLLNLDVNKKYVIYAGRLRKIKGSDFLIPIFKSVYEKNSNVELLIVGDGELKEYIIEETKKNGIIKSVHYFDFMSQQQLSKFIGASDVLILPSRNEAWGCVVNEALACGIPVVGSNVEGIVQAIGGQQYGSTINMSEDSSFEKFAASIKHWLDKNYNPYELRNKALKYTWEEQTRKEIDYIEKIILTSKVKG